MKHKKIVFYCSLLFFCALLTFLIVKNVENNNENVSTNSAAMAKHTIVIDAGHGGEDGGADANGILEKDINLDISLKLRDLLKLSGFNVVMVRDTDKSIYDASAKTVREKKVSDLQNRLKIFNSSEDNIVVSIHQNKFPQTQYFGAQIFYSPNNPQSKTLAQNIKNTIVTMTQPDNKRELKKADKSIFLLWNAKSTSVIVECGFISNQKEASLLNQDSYRKNIAFSIYCGIVNYVNSQ
ncbi:MAG: N-acetylmuramoyl-L-alanine amidase [Bacillota bacterium]|nr:N-acetylmuramoyl-L-alanine amidase [Bacillota bacterium]